MPIALSLEILEIFKTQDIVRGSTVRFMRSNPQGELHEVVGSYFDMSDRIKIHAILLDDGDRMVCHRFVLPRTIMKIS